MRRLAAIAALAMAWLGSGQASAAAPTSRLVYSRSTDASSCPDEQALRRAVAARVGYDPFFAWATRTIVAGITRRDAAFVATVDMVDDRGVSHGARELRTTGECGELLDAVALAIAIAIDPQSLSRTGPPPAPPPSEPPKEESPAAAPPAVPSTTTDAETPTLSPTVPPPAGVAFELSAGAVASGGVAPGPAAGLALGAGARWRAYSLALEGRIDAPASTSAPGGGDVTSWLVLGSLVPCLHLGPVFGCALGQVGSVQTSGSGVPHANSASAPWWAAGGRVGVMFALSDDVMLRVRTDVLANIDRATLQLNGGTAWLAPPVVTSLGTDFVLHFR